MLFEEYEEERPVSGDDSKRPAKPVIYTLTIECVFGIHLREECQRVIEMKSTDDLNDLHFAIQNAVKFDNDHLFEFFIGPNYRRRKIVFSEDDNEDAAHNPVGLWRIWPLPKNMSLFYWFDFGDDWKFRIKKSRSTKAPEKGVRYPRVISEVGPNPEQYPDYDE